MKLIVDGAVLTPVELGFDDLAALPGQVDDISTVVSGREGGGVLLSRVLGRAGLRADATHVTCESTDGKFRASVPLAAVREAIVAYRLGDDPLPASHGGPLRFLIPDAGACASAEVDRCANVKFLGRLHVTRGAGDDSRPGCSK